MHRGTSPPNAQSWRTSMNSSYYAPTVDRPVGTMTAPSIRLSIETHVAEECVQYMDNNYRTRANRGSRAISGMSMGGHGAMYLAIRHPDTFGTSVCLMGGVDIRPFPNNWEIKKRLGDMSKHRKNWEEHTVINQARKLKDEQIKIVLDCGRGDFFLQVNRALHMQLLQDGISHIYEEHEGVHNWQFCKDAIERQFPYIATQFARNR